MSAQEFFDRLARGYQGLSERVPRVLEDPRAYPRETMLLAVIAAVLLLFVVLLVIIAADVVRAGRSRRRLRVRRRPVAAVLTALSVAGVLGVVVLAIALAPGLRVVAPACGLCHEVETAVTSWRAGPHAVAPCYGCHAPAGMLGALEASTRGAGALVSEAQRPPATGERCLGCHDDLADGTKKTQDLFVRHKEIIEAGGECLSCHPGVGHDESGGDATDDVGPDPTELMSRCLLCHDDDTASAECATCHRTAPLDQASDPAYPGTTPIRVTCKGCHQSAVEARCTACHGIEMPHPADFSRDHARRSAQEPELCASCHAEAAGADACTCHLDVNLHGTYSEWFPVHGTAALANGQGGCACHSEASCARCHREDPW